MRYSNIFKDLNQRAELLGPQSFRETLDSMFEDTIKIYDKWAHFSFEIFFLSHSNVRLAICISFSANSRAVLSLSLAQTVSQGTNQNRRKPVQDKRLLNLEMLLRSFIDNS